MTRRASSTPDRPASPTTIAGSFGVQVGDHNLQTNVGVDPAGLPPPQRVPAEATAGATVHNLPLGSAVFVGRDLQQLAELFGGDGSGVVVGQAAVHGLGGIGKTELAVLRPGRIWTATGWCGG